MIRTTNVRHGKVDTKSVRCVTKETFDKWVRRGAPKKGDIIFTREAPVGEIGLLKSNGMLFLGQRTMMYRADHDKSNNLFILYSLQTRFCQKQIENFSNGGTVAHMRVPDCGEIILRVSPLPEQKKIAQILSTWDKAIETVEKLIENSQQKKKALMQQLLTGKKRFPGFDGEWKKQTIEELEDQDILTLSRGQVISKKDIARIPGQYPIYSSSVKNSGLFGRYGKYMFDEELITWSVDGGGNFFYRPKHRFSVTNVSGFMRVDTNAIDYRFFAAQLDYLHGKLKFDYQTKAHPSVIRKLYTVLLPSLKEQQRITSVLSAVDREIETWQQELKHLKQEKKALMQQLLTGKRRVKVDEILA